MRFVHLSDLHIGKRVNEFSMLEDQRYIFAQIIEIIRNNDIDAVLIAGDVYDRSVPGEEAVRLFEEFIIGLTDLGKKIFVISGNHDSAQRLSFAHELISKSGVYISPAYDGSSLPVTLMDEYGEVNIYMLPFIKPSSVKSCFADAQIESFDDAVRFAINRMNVDESKRNIILAHQFVTGSQTSDSEERSIGGLDNVDADAFDAFDYVALGHIHKPQRLLRDTLRYSGTPLKYSFSEEDNKNSVVVVDFKEKGSIDINLIPLKPIRDMRTVKGKYEEITLKSSYDGSNRDDYIRVVLTDEDDVMDAMARLRAVYPNIMKLEYDNKRSSAGRDFSLGERVEDKTEIELFTELYEQQNGMSMNEKQQEFVERIVSRLKGDMQ